MCNATTAITRQIESAFAPHHSDLQSHTVQKNTLAVQAASSNLRVMMWQKLKAFFGGETQEAAVFHDEWIALLKKSVPLYARLPEDLRLRLHERIAQFIATIRFEGCGGLELTEAMILTVAAQACLLVVQREGKPYPKLSAVYLYPTTFSSVRKNVDAHGIVTEGRVSRLGESWGWGTVVLAWDSVLQGARCITDGDNVTFHEFAHQLDHEDGPTDGAPALASDTAYRQWSRVFHDNYADFLQRTEEGTETVLNAYGATNPAEFLPWPPSLFLRSRSSSMMSGRKCTRK